MVSAWMMAALAGIVAVASCSSLDSGSSKTGTGGKAAGGANGSGGMVGGMGGSGTGGSGTGGSANGAGGEPVDAAVDVPASDSSQSDVAPPCGPANDCCPNDPNKTEPGMCGCGVADTDTDGDSIADCIDECPNDSAKFAAGVCGCGLPETYNGDTDGDGRPDCLDECPKDPTRTKAGICGCGIADNTPLCLAHRYQFNDVAPDGGASDGGSGDGGAVSGAIIHDSVGTADGVAVRATPNGNGTITLAGGNPNPATDQYIQLPAGIISSLGNNATFETWVTWTGTGGVWQRIFDFGGNEMPPGNKGTGNSFIFLSPQNGITPGVLFVSFITVGNAVSEITTTAALPAGTVQHLAVVVDNTPADAGTPSVILYLNGVRAMATPLGNQLNNLNDVNNWLGRSQFAPDPSFSGTYSEFRIYSTARTAAQIAASFAAGPDTLPAN